MRRADRLLSFVQILRRHRRPVTAADLAAELEISERTVYRDVVLLQASGVPVRGEAGIGYVLEAGYDLPPLMFTPDELEAVMLGLRFVGERGDVALARASADAVAKIDAVLPQALRPIFADAPLFAPLLHDWPATSIDLVELRRAIRTGLKVEIAYIDAQQEATTRTIWPFAVGYFDASCMVIAWCELRNDFRHFRTDRISRLTVLGKPYPTPRRKLLAEWQRGWTQSGGTRNGAKSAAPSSAPAA